MNKCIGPKCQSVCVRYEIVVTFISAGCPALIFPTEADRQYRLGLSDVQMIVAVKI